MHPHSPSCATCGSRVTSTFASLSINEADQLTETKGCSNYGRGAVVFNYGAYPRGVYCIHDGHVKLTRPTPDGREQILRLAGSGDLVGYASMISGEPYTLNCIAVEDSSICFVPTDVILSMVRDNTHLALRVMQDLSHEVEDAERRVVEIAQKSVRERVAEALLVIKETFGVAEDGETLNNPLTREEIAGIVGTAQESVIRTLAEFKSDRLIEVVGRSIRLKNVKGLIKTANLID